MTRWWHRYVLKHKVTARAYGWNEMALAVWWSCSCGKAWMG